MNYKDFLRKFGEGTVKMKKLSYKEKLLEDKKKDARITRVLKNIKQTIVSKKIKYKEAFKKFDLNNDKRINAKELK
jgi:Ca2+-binding EF-hand superfamily protein